MAVWASPSLYEHVYFVLKRAISLEKRQVFQPVKKDKPFTVNKMQTYTAHMQQSTLNGQNKTLFVVLQCM